MGGAGGERMIHKQVLQLMFHGLLLVVVGMLAGLPFQHAITSNWGPETERAWRVAHTSLMMAGILYLAIAAIAHHLVLSRGAAQFVTWSLVISAYAFVFAFIVGPSIGARGLEPTGPPLHILIFAVFVVSLLLAFLAVEVIAWGAFSALRGRGNATSRG